MVYHGSPVSPHEGVYKFSDDMTGMRAIIAVHSTALGPAAGGCRIWRYENEADAMQDALRLSEGMTYKNALAGLPFGGGKAVIMLPPNASASDFDRVQMFETFGRWVESLSGRYITAEDVGCSVKDMQMASRCTRYISGLPVREGFAGGDPSPWTAKGVFGSIKAAVKQRLGCGLEHVVVGVQGLGHVGFALCGLLHEAGVKLLVSDINQDTVALAARLYDAQAVKPDKVLEAPMDVFAPCALGGILTAEAAARLKAQIVCGAANNQLATPLQGQQLAKRGILYAPDYLVNAGGIINVSAEYLQETPASVEQRVAQIPKRLLQLMVRSELEGVAMNILADQMAQDIVATAKKAAVA